MVAKSPRIRPVAVAAPPLSPTLLRDTVKKVDKCVSRLQELQQRATTTNTLPCKHQSFRIKSGKGQRSSSPPGKLPSNTEDWRRMSLPAMLLGETMEEIMHTSKFTRTLVQSISSYNPTTPPSHRREKLAQHSELHARRKREKLLALQTNPTQRARSRINFNTHHHKENNCSYNTRSSRVSPRNRPLAKKVVMFPNPLFLASPPRKNRAIPHKFLIRSPPPCASKLHVKIRGHPLCVSPTRAVTTSLVKKSNAAKLPSKVMSPLMSSGSVRKSEGMNVMSGLKQRPTAVSVKSYNPRI